MRDFLAMAKALSDENRVRALLALRGGELCLCQIIDLLGLAPSTVSKHMDLLARAGLVEKRKDGRWHYFKLAGREAPPAVRQAIRWTLDALRDEPVAGAVSAQLCCVQEKELDDLVACYRR